MGISLCNAIFLSKFSLQLSLFCSLLCPRKPELPEPHHWDLAHWCQTAFFSVGGTPGLQQRDGISHHCHRIRKDQFCDSQESCPTTSLLWMSYFLTLSRLSWQPDFSLPCSSLDPAPSLKIISFKITQIGVCHLFLTRILSDTRSS